MKRLTIICAALVLAVVAVGIVAGAPLAQTGTRSYEACEPQRASIRAAALPEVVDQERCPVAGRTIVDHGVGAVVPAPGESVFAEATSPRGNEQLVVMNPVGGKLVLAQVGSEQEEPHSGTLATRAGGPDACSDSYYNSWGSRLNHYIKWYFNGNSTPSQMSTFNVVMAARRAGNNVSGVQDSCGIGDGVPAVLKYVGLNNSSVNMTADGICRANDHKSIVGFGDLPARFTGKTCVWAWIQKGPDRINASDVRLNKVDYRWTTSVTGSCRGRQDVESTMTHERGHTFGLGDASESSHPNLTMSSASNGPCQTSERSLGRGDAIGLNNKYP